MGFANFRLCHQPVSLGAVTSRPSFESSLRAISRIRPIKRKSRRRLTVLAGATDKRNTGKNHDITNAEKTLRGLLPIWNSWFNAMITKNMLRKEADKAACSLSFANSVITTTVGENNAAETIALLAAFAAGNPGRVI